MKKIITQCNLEFVEVHMQVHMHFTERARLKQLPCK